MSTNVFQSVCMSVSVYACLCICVAVSMFDCVWLSGLNMCLEIKGYAHFYLGSQ